MADNTTLNAGSGGDTYASDDIGGVKYQRVKLIQGADGTNSGDSSVTLPFPTSSVLRCDAIAESATTLLTVKFARFDQAASGEVIALVASKKLRVLSIFATNGNAAANLLTFKSGGSGGTVIANVQLEAGVGKQGQPLFCPVGIFQTVAGENLYLTLSSATQVYGGITYVEAT